MKLTRSDCIYDSTFLHHTPVLCHQQGLSDGATLASIMNAIVTQWLHERSNVFAILHLGRYDVETCMVTPSYVIMLSKWMHSCTPTRRLHPKHHTSTHQSRVSIGGGDLMLVFAWNNSRTMIISRPNFSFPDSRLATSSGVVWNVEAVVIATLSGFHYEYKHSTNTTSTSQPHYSQVTSSGVTDVETFIILRTTFPQSILTLVSGVTLILRSHPIIMSSCEHAVPCQR